MGLGCVVSWGGWIWSRALVSLLLSFRKILLIQLWMSSMQVMMAGGFGGDVDMCVIGIAVNVDPMMTEDCAQGEEVVDEEEWTQD